MWLQQQRSLESNVWQIRLTRRNNKLCQRFQSEATFPQLSLRQPLFPPRSSCLPFFALCFSDCYHHLSALLPENEPVLCARQIVLSGGRAMLRVFRRSASGFCERPNVTGHISPGIIHHIKGCFLKRQDRTFFSPPFTVVFFLPHLNDVFPS